MGGDSRMRAQVCRGDVRVSNDGTPRRTRDLARACETSHETPTCADAPNRTKGSHAHAQFVTAASHARTDRRTSMCRGPHRIAGRGAPPRRESRHRSLAPDESRVRRRVRRAQRGPRGAQKRTPHSRIRRYGTRLEYTPLPSDDASVPFHPYATIRRNAHRCMPHAERRCAHRNGSLIPLHQ